MRKRGAKTRSNIINGSHLSFYSRHLCSTCRVSSGALFQSKLASIYVIWYVSEIIVPILYSTFSIIQVEAAHNYKSADKFDNRKTYMSYLVKNIDQYVDDNRRYENSRSKNRATRCLMTGLPNVGRFLGNYIVILYFFVKVLYILNTCIQVFIISGLLGKSFWVFGYEFLEKLITGYGWTVTNSKYFPS